MVRWGAKPGQALSRYYQVLAALITGVYFGRIQVLARDESVLTKTGPRLIVSSHRNGALDGYVTLTPFPVAQFLVSIQLLRKWVLRLLFTGIPVVREKDRQRYGIDRAAVGSPVDAGVAHLRAGGDLIVFPEGSSEWRHNPLPYQRGAARMACALLTEGVPLTVIPMGLHYPQPDRFRSPVDLVIGEALSLPARAEGEPDKAWEDRMHAAISEGLRAVSVDCPDQATFEATEAKAREAVLQEPQRETYGKAFLATQNGRRVFWERPSKVYRVRGWEKLLLGIAALVFAPIVLGGWWAGRKADARNTVSFFRVLGGLAGALIWVPLCFTALSLFPLVTGVAVGVGVLGWWRYPQAVGPMMPATPRPSRKV